MEELTTITNNTMKKHYESPHVEEVLLTIEDRILTTSNLDLQTENQNGVYWDE